MTTPQVELLFPKEKLTPLPTDRIPTPIEVRQFKRELVQNARAIPSALGGGNHGHLGLVLTAADYATAAGAGNAFALPNHPVVPGMGGTNQAIAVARANYDHEMAIYHTSHAVNRALKAQILEAVPAFCIQALSHDLNAFADVTVQALVTHMVTTYGVITEDDLSKNLDTMAAAWDPNTPIEAVFSLAHKCRQFATAGLDPISDANSVRQCLAAFEKSGVMEEAIKDWRKKPTADRTWANMPTHFIAANKERLRTATLASTGFNTANAATNASKPKNSTSTGASMCYCWTHGLGFNPEHTSESCSRPAEGHQKKATADNMLGGNNTIRRKRGEQAIYKRPTNTNTANPRST